MSPTDPETPAPRLDGLRVAVFESRKAAALAELVARQGGVPVAAPALREVPIGSNPDAVAFARGLRDGRFDMVVFLTGVGARYLSEEVADAVPLPDLTDALRRVAVVARGPKPLAVLREWGVPVAVAVPEPNTWHELLAAIDAHGPVAGTRVAVQEYGTPNPDLVAGLEQRGAVVTRVPVYRYSLPENLGPLRAAIAEIAGGTIGAAAFTTAQQVVHLSQVAAEAGLEPDVISALRDRVIVASVGPTTNAALAERGIAPDIVPEHPKMGPLVVALARRWRESPKAAGLPTSAFGVPAQARPTQVQDPDRLRDSPFLRACRGEPTPVTPIWLMRQAGRYMPEYRALRARVGFLDLCKTPALAAEVTITAAERLGVDAAILFADILLILEPLGFQLEFSKGEGPVIHNPVRTAADVDRVAGAFDPESLGFVYEAVRQIRAGLPGDLPLIGFAGAPFTLACYAIEGGGSRHYERAKAFLYRDPGAWDALLTRLTDATAAYLSAQAAAGAQALQVFDSWVGTLGPHDYARFVQPHMRRLFAALPADVATIHFGTGTATLIEHQRDAGGQVIGLDWRVELDEARARLGPKVAVQGNLDPAVLLGPSQEVRRQARRILDQAGGRPGHIFNLGHGVLPGTPVENVLGLIAEVRAYSEARRGRP
jgi:uroporphyrinogen decarboxylase